tara:strand:+ start:3154 stop:4107 length:954 start_codon:yes stop_codon:yes gene_type:complete
MKVFSHPPGEDWIIDRITSEFCLNTTHDVTSLYDCDTIVLFAPWVWRQYPVQALKEKKLVVMMHHIVEEKFNVEEFKARDVFVDQYIVPNKHTLKSIDKHTTKPIEEICYWINPELWPSIDKIKAREDFKKICSKNKNSLVTNVGLDIDFEKHTVIGSFQRDTEGSDLKTPKYEKGPDLFIKSIENIKNRENLLILLGGWRRQYIISQLEELGVKYIHLNRPPLETINLMYDCLDLYIVSSRFEGGPQAIIECAYKKVPIISNDMGIAKTILHEECVVNVEDNFFIPKEIHVNYAYETCLNVLLSRQIKEYDKVIRG